MPIINNLRKRNGSDQVILLFIMWLLVQSILIWKYGIVTTLEATKYIDEAKHFITYGRLNTDNHYLYFTEILLIALVIKLRIGYSVIVLIQLLLNLVATYMFNKLADSFLKNKTLVFLATLFFIGNILYQVYNSYLFTESVFYSLTIIYSSYLLRLQKLDFNNVITIIFFLFLLSITRPTGILFFTASVVFILFRFIKNKNILLKMILLSAAIIVFLFIVNGMLQAGGSLDFMQPFKRENIICGVNTTSAIELNTLEKGNSLHGLLYFIYNNSNEFFKMAKLKTIAFFGMLRTYYSLSHNIYLIIFFYPFYILSFIGIWKKFKQRDTRIIYFISLILLYWITTLLTCDDWHNRFVLTVSPFIFLLGFSAFISLNKKERLL